MKVNPSTNKEIFQGQNTYSSRDTQKEESVPVFIEDTPSPTHLRF